MILDRTGRESHPAADLFPMMGDEELRALADDIREHGLQERICLCGTSRESGAPLVIDGRNRLRACEMARVQPEFQWVTPESPVAWVLSRNLHRRHLTESQRAMIGAKAKAALECEAKGRSIANLRHGDEQAPEVANLPPRAEGKSRDRAAALVNVSPRTVETASKVLKRGAPELVEAVERGDVAVSAAAAVADEPADRQRALVAEGPKAIKAAAREKRKAAPKLSAAERARLEALIAAGPESEAEEPSPIALPDAGQRLALLVERIDDARRFASGAKALALIGAARDAATAASGASDDAERRYADLRAGLFDISSGRKSNRR